jgi:hypothetical protein
MREHPLVARYFGVLVGTSRAGRSHTAEEIADHLLWRMADETGELKFDPEVFDRLYKEFNADLRANDIEFVGVAPTSGFNLYSS